MIRLDLCRGELDGAAQALAAEIHAGTLPLPGIPIHRGIIRRTARSSTAPTSRLWRRPSGIQPSSPLVSWSYCRPSTFFCLDASAAPLLGEVIIEVAPEGLRLHAHRRPTSLISWVSVIVALMVLGATVATLMVGGDAHGLLDHEEGWRLVLALGTLAVVGSFGVTRKLLSHRLSTRMVVTNIAFRHVVSATAEEDWVWIASSSPELLGRITFRTPDPAAVLRALGDGKRA